VLPGEPARAGRWRGAAKIECGIHVANGKVIRMSAEASLDGPPDPDGPLWKGDAFRRDPWLRAAEIGTLPDAPVIVPEARWLAARDELRARNAPLGLLLEAGAGLDDVAADLPRFALIALDFPKFSDGRAFSTARLLREKHGFAGELRAVGNVLSDQIPFMRRVGFDAFEVAHGPTRRALIEGRIPEVSLHYQPAGPGEPPAGTRPWLRRSAGKG
jgi:phosphoadenosine phosphosulfate reductase